jgi:hypothetical protein
MKEKPRAGTAANQSVIVTIPAPTALFKSNRIGVFWPEFLRESRRYIA